MTAALLTEEQLLLTRHDAERIIGESGRKCLRVVKVCDDDAILYLSTQLRPWTAWLRRMDDHFEVQHEEGWSSQFGSLAAVSDVRVVPFDSGDDGVAVTD